MGFFHCCLCLSKSPPSLWFCPSYFFFFNSSLLLKVMIGPNSLRTLLCHPVQSILLITMEKLVRLSHGNRLSQLHSSQHVIFPAQEPKKSTTFSQDPHSLALPTDPSLLQSLPTSSLQLTCSASAPRDQPKKESWLEGRIYVQKITSYPQFTPAVRPPALE